MIQELLSAGRENALTAKDLAAILGTDKRGVTQIIEKERRQGAPICANTGMNAGYYIGSPEEVTAYCGRLRHRAGEIFKTRAALLNCCRKE